MVLRSVSISLTYTLSSVRFSLHFHFIIYSLSLHLHNLKCVPSASITYPSPYLDFSFSLISRTSKYLVFVELSLVLPPFSSPTGPFLLVLSHISAIISSVVCWYRSVPFLHYPAIISLYYCAIIAQSVCLLLLSPRPARPASLVCMEAGDGGN